jgi:hypothetical protein
MAKKWSPNKEHTGQDSLSESYENGVLSGARRGNLSVTNIKGAQNIKGKGSETGQSRPNAPTGKHGTPTPKNKIGRLPTTTKVNGTQGIGGKHG